MRIAQVAPLFESVPPRWYGGTERVVSYITEELVRQGHEVTLFASGDSVTGAQLVPGCEMALRLDERCRDHFAWHVVQLEEAVRRSTDFDVMHFHVDYMHFPISRRMDTPHLTTLHGRLDLPELHAIYREYGDMPVVSISDAQRRPLPFAQWMGTVHHGLPDHVCRLHPEPGTYLAFMGRISPEKRLDRAIEIAQRTGIPLKVAAKVDRADRDYYEEQIRPLIGGPLVDYIGEIGEQEKDEFLGNAVALLFPVDWPEPFGLVMIEAMACGTPVIAWPHGSVPEVLEEGLTGFIVESIDEAVGAVENLAAFDRVACRARFERRFTVRRMTNDYLDLYAALTREKLAGLLLPAAADKARLAGWTSA